MQAHKSKQFVVLEISLALMEDLCGFSLNARGQQRQAPLIRNDSGHQMYEYEKSSEMGHSIQAAIR